MKLQVTIVTLIVVLVSVMVLALVDAQLPNYGFAAEQVSAEWRGFKLITFNAVLPVLVSLLLLTSVVSLVVTETKPKLDRNRLKVTKPKPVQNQHHLPDTDTKTLPKPTPETDTDTEPMVTVTVGEMDDAAYSAVMVLQREGSVAAAATFLGISTAGVNKRVERAFHADPAFVQERVPTWVERRK